MHRYRCIYLINWIVVVTIGKWFKREKECDLSIGKGNSNIEIQFGSFRFREIKIRGRVKD